jgi:inorganic pyrophosphatase
MGAVILPDLGTEILIPACAVIGIVFALFQWLIVSKVKLTAGIDSSSEPAPKNGYNDSLIEEEEGINDHNVVLKCAEIQNAISEGINHSLFHTLPIFRSRAMFFVFLRCNCLLIIDLNFVG